MADEFVCAIGAHIHFIVFHPTELVTVKAPGGLRIGGGQFIPGAVAVSGLVVRKSEAGGVRLTGRRNGAHDIEGGPLGVADQGDAAHLRNIHCRHHHLPTRGTDGVQRRIYIVNSDIAQP